MTAVIHKDYSHVIFSLKASLLKCSIVATEYKMHIFSPKEWLLNQLLNLSHTI